MKKFKMIDGVKHKAIGYTYDGKPIGWIACGKNEMPLSTSHGSETDR